MKIADGTYRRCRPIVLSAHPKGASTPVTHFGQVFSKISGRRVGLVSRRTAGKGDQDKCGATRADRHACAVGWQPPDLRGRCHNGLLPANPP